MRRTTTVLLGAAGLISLLAACGTGVDVGSIGAPATSEPTTPDRPTPDSFSTDTPVDPTDGGPTFPRNTTGRTAEPSGEWSLVLKDVRVGEHESFDRIVLEFSGKDTPGWAVDYVDQAVLDGSGKAVALGGDAVLDIYASGTTYPGPGGDHYSGPRQFEPENGGDVRDMHVGGTFEGYTQVLVGIDGDPAPFRVFALTDPPRLVVDVDDVSAD